MPTPPAYYGKSVMVTGYNSQTDELQIFLQDIREYRTVTWGDRNDILDFAPSSSNLCTYPPVIGRVGTYYMGLPWCERNDVPTTGEVKHPTNLIDPGARSVVDAEVTQLTPVALLIDDHNAGGIPTQGMPGWIGPIVLTDIGTKVVPDPQSPINHVAGTSFIGARIDDRWLLARWPRRSARGRQRQMSGLVVGFNVTLLIHGHPYDKQTVEINPMDRRIVLPHDKNDPGSPTKIELDAKGQRGAVALDSGFLAS